MNASHATGVLTIDIHSMRGEGTWIKTTTLATPRCDGLERRTFLRRFQLTGMTTSKIATYTTPWHMILLDGAPPPTSRSEKRGREKRKGPVGKPRPMSLQV